jgi:hypothetical protein
MPGWLGLIAAPGFALMAFVTGVTEGRADIICAAAPSWFAGMVPMYLLMSVVHAGPWLNLVADYLLHKHRELS